MLSIEPISSVAAKLNLLKYTMKSTGLDYLKAEYVVPDHITQGHAMNQQGRARKNLVHRFCSVAQILGLGSF